MYVPLHRLPLVDVAIVQIKSISDVFGRRLSFVAGGNFKRSATGA
jgi:hypothetical protein